MKLGCLGTGEAEALLSEAGADAIQWSAAGAESLIANILAKEFNLENVFDGDMFDEGVDSQLDRRRSDCRASLDRSASSILRRSAAPIDVATFNRLKASCLMKQAIVEVLGASGFISHIHSIGAFTLTYVPALQERPK